MVGIWSKEGYLYVSISAYFFIHIFINYIVYR